jgi:hypothetical protein
MSADESLSLDGAQAVNPKTMLVTLKKESAFKKVRVPWCTQEKIPDLYRSALMLKEELSIVVPENISFDDIERTLKECTENQKGRALVRAKRKTNAKACLIPPNDIKKRILSAGVIGPGPWYAKEQTKKLMEHLQRNPTDDNSQTILNELISRHLINFKDLRGPDLKFLDPSNKALFFNRHFKSSVEEFKRGVFALSEHYSGMLTNPAYREGEMTSIAKRFNFLVVCDKTTGKTLYSIDVHNRGLKRYLPVCCQVESKEEKKLHNVLTCFAGRGDDIYPSVKHLWSHLESVVGLGLDNRLIRYALTRFPTTLGSGPLTSSGPWFSWISDDEFSSANDQTSNRRFGFLLGTHTSTWPPWVWLDMLHHCQQLDKGNAQGLTKRHRVEIEPVRIDPSMVQVFKPNWTSSPGHTQRLIDKMLCEFKNDGSTL